MGRGRDEKRANPCYRAIRDEIRAKCPGAWHDLSGVLCVTEDGWTIDISNVIIIHVLWACQEV